MSTGFHGNGRDGDTVRLDGTGSATSAAPTDTLVASTVGDRCVNCGSTLSSDQRYCVVCGERRAAPRFTLPPTTVTTTTEVTSTSTGGSPRDSRFASGTTLVAGVGTLLLALLVGFLIGNAASRNNTRTVNAATPAIKVVNVGGGGGSSSGAATTATTSTATHRTSSRPHRTARTVHKTIITKKVVSAEASAAKKVLGGTNTPPPTTKVGQTCSGSQCTKAGYNKQTHKFDGSFFGP